MHIAKLTRTDIAEDKKTSSSSAYNLDFAPCDYASFSWTAMAVLTTCRIK